MVHFDANGKEIERINPFVQDDREILLLCQQNLLTEEQIEVWKV